MTTWWTLKRKVQLKYDCIILRTRIKIYGKNINYYL
jgi:hypothetical protein